MRLLLLLLLVTGCSHTREFSRPRLDNGQQSDWVLTQSTAIGIMSPSIKVLYWLNKKTGEVKPYAGEQFSGNGIGGNAVNAAGTAIGLHQLGRGISKSGDDTTVNQSGGGGKAEASADSDSHSSSRSDARSTANPTLIGPPMPPPVAPPRTRPPDNRPPIRWNR